MTWNANMSPTSVSELTFLWKNSIIKQDLINNLEYATLIINSIRYDHFTSHLKDTTQCVKLTI